MKSRHVALELIKHPLLLLDAAKMGNLDIVDMITRDYPHLLSHMYEEQCSIFHIVVRHRSKDTLEFLRKVRDVKKINAVSRDNEGNNFLHSAAKSKHPEGSDFLILQDEFDWFLAVKDVAPPFYWFVRNISGYTPAELLVHEYRQLLRSSEAAGIKGTTESCMLISTIVITVMFAAAFAPPGGYNQDTGIPTLLKKKWFTSFIIFQVLALTSSTLSIIGFWSIISSDQNKYWSMLVPVNLRLSMCALLLSMLFIISAFLSAFFLIFVEERKGLVVSFMLPLYLVLVVGISLKLFRVLQENYWSWHRDSNPYK